ncbi:hypothetical protein C8R43DRAFT_1129325 [Mycena crocata]|nr:hypothetical protein C8R43DRAFT_1129325 [Mycena crocata]
MQFLAAVRGTILDPRTEYDFQSYTNLVRRPDPVLMRERTDIPLQNQTCLSFDPRGPPTNVYVHHADANLTPRSLWKGLILRAWRHPRPGTNPPTIVFYLEIQWFYQLREVENLVPRSKDFVDSVERAICSLDLILSPHKTIIQAASVDSVCPIEDYDPTSLLQRWHTENHWIFRYQLVSLVDMGTRSAVRATLGPWDIHPRSRAEDNECSRWCHFKCAKRTTSAGDHDHRRPVDQTTVQIILTSTIERGYGGEDPALDPFLPLPPTWPTAILADDKRPVAIGWPRKDAPRLARALIDYLQRRRPLLELTCRCGNKL